MNKVFSLIRKSLLVLVFTLVLGFGLTQNVSVNAANAASFSISKTEMSKTLSYGVVYKSVSGLSNTANSTSQVAQVCNAVEIPSIEGLVVTSWANMGATKWNMSKVNIVAQNYEETHPGYTVIAAVNGDFYDINAEKNFPRSPTGCEVNEGNFYKATPTQSTGYQVISFTNDGTANSLVSYDKSVVKVNELPTLAIFDENDEIIAEYQINKVNEAAGENEIAVFYGSYNSSQAYVERAVVGETTGTFAVGKAIYCLPHKANDFYGIGVITKDVVNDVANNQFVIKSNNEEVNSKLAEGVKIRVQYEWNGEASEVVDALNAGTQVLKNGEVASNANTGDGSRMSARHPRTAIGVKADGTIVLMVNDGRQESLGRYGSYGDELACMMKEFGCVNAYNLDGGGSSILYYRDGDKLVLGNKYSDASERSISNIVLVAVKDPEFNVEFTELGSRNITAKVNLVNANGHNINDYYVRVESKEVQVVDGVVTVTGLQALTRYTLKIFYKTPNGKSVTTLTSFDFATSAKEYKFKGIDLTPDGDNYIFSIEYTDTGASTNLAEAKVKINGKEYQLVDGKVTIPQSDFDMIHELIVIFNLKTIDGFVETTLINPHAKSWNNLAEGLNQLNELITSIYE